MSRIQTEKTLKTEEGLKEDIQKEFQGVFGQVEQNYELQNAQRKQNDFQEFFKEGSKKTRYFQGKVYKEPKTKKELILQQEQSVKDLQQQILKEKKELQEFNSRNSIINESYNQENNKKNQQEQQSVSMTFDSKSYNKIKNQKYKDFFNEKIINPGNLSQTQKIDLFINQKPNFAQTQITVPITQIMHERNMNDAEYKQHYAFIQKRNLNLTNQSINQSKFQNNATNNNQNANLTYNQSSISSFGENSSKGKSTYLFSGQPRFWRGKNQNQNGSSQYNQLVGESTIRNHNTRYYSELLNKPKKSIDTQFLQSINGQYKEYYNNQDRVKDVIQSTKLPSQQQQAFRKDKEKFEQYKQWKKDMTYNLKQKNIMKNTYRSGVVSMDSPFLSQTNIYKDEFQKIQQKEQKQIKNQQAREQYLNKFIISHPDIGFQNSYAREKNVQTKLENQNQNNIYNTQKQVQQQPFPYQSHQISPDWVSKKQGKNTAQKLPTFQNCFGHDLEDQKQKIINHRSLHLREQDLKGKTFNPLTGAALAPIS